MHVNLPEPVNGLVKGLEPRNLVSFYGAPGSGKSNICLLAAVNCVKAGGRVIYMDTEGGFNKQRLRQMTNSWQDVMDKTVLLEPRNFGEQAALTKELDRHRADLFIVDSMVSLYRLEHAEKNGNSRVRERGGPSRAVLEANRELSRQLSVLSGLAREKEVPVLITAHTFRHWDTKLNEIVGGDAIKYWSRVIVYIEKTGRMSERKATLIKHVHQPEWGSVKFSIVDTGIKPAGFKIF